MSESHVVMGGEETEKGLQEKHCMLVNQNLALTEKHKTDRTQKWHWEMTIEYICSV